MVGRLDFAMASLSTALPQIRARKLTALGVAGPARADTAPDIPTIAEQEFQNFDMQLWFGIWAPAQTPPAIVQQIIADLNRAMLEPDFQLAFGKAGMQSQSMGQQILRAS